MKELPATMRGVILTGHGGPEMLSYRTDLAVPRPRPGEVLVQVMAAGVNNTDINTRVGWYSKHEGADADASWAGAPIGFPRIQGIDVCGIIVGAGEGVPPGRIGTRVLIEPCLREAGGSIRERPWFLGSECDGGFAEYVAVAARHAHTVKSALSDIELASFPCSYSTAENMLARAQVGDGDTVLVTGASGGVGSAAVQLARARGATVIAVTQDRKAAALRKLGAARCVPRGPGLLEALGRDSVDVVVDLTAGPDWPLLPELLRPFGRYAVAGAIAGPMVDLDVRTLYLKDLTFFGCTVLGDGVFASLIAHIEAGRIAPLVAESYRLKDIAKAQAAFERKDHIGKIVLEVGTSGAPESKGATT